MSRARSGAATVIPKQKQGNNKVVQQVVPCKVVQYGTCAVDDDVQAATVTHRLVHVPQRLLHPPQRLLLPHLASRG